MVSRDTEQLLCLRFNTGTPDAVSVSRCALRVLKQAAFSVFLYKQFHSDGFNTKDRQVRNSLFALETHWLKLAISPTARFSSEAWRSVRIIWLFDQIHKTKQRELARRGKRLAEHTSSVHPVQKSTEQRRDLTLWEGIRKHCSSWCEPSRLPEPSKVIRLTELLKGLKRDTKTHEA